MTVPGLGPRPDWQHRAACHGLPLDWWWNRGPRTRAIRICATCPVAVDCLLYAFANDHQEARRARQEGRRPVADEGTWGGAGPRARRQGAAAWRTGGDTWTRALREHLDWLAAEADATGRLSKHPWNQRPPDELTHGLAGSYNHCTAGAGGGPCEQCRLGRTLRTTASTLDRKDPAA